MYDKGQQYCGQTVQHSDHLHTHALILDKHHLIKTGRVFPACGQALPFGAKALESTDTGGGCY